MTIFNIYSGQLGEQQFEAIGRSIGTTRDEAVLGSAQAVPILVSAMARISRSGAGAKALGDLLDRHDGSLLMKLPALYANPAIGQGEGLLQNLLGNKVADAVALVSRESRIPQTAAQKLFVLTAPILLAMIGMKKRQDKIDDATLAQMLQHFADLHEREESGEAAPEAPAEKSGFLGGLGSLAGNLAGSGGGLGGALGNLGGIGDVGGMLKGGNFSGIGKLIAGLLDRDKDGDVMDDISGMAGGLLGGKK